MTLLVIAFVLCTAAYAQTTVTDLYETAQGSVVLTSSQKTVTIASRLSQTNLIHNQYIYSPYGQQKNLNHPVHPISTTGNHFYAGLFNQTRKALNITHNQFGYTGQAADPSTSLMMLGGFRNYAPGIGQFIQPDTYNSFSNISINNRSAYVENNPLSAVDPTGHFASFLAWLPLGIMGGGSVIGTITTAALFAASDGIGDALNFNFSDAAAHEAEEAQWQEVDADTQSVQTSFLSFPEDQSEIATPPTKAVSLRGSIETTDPSSQSDIIEKFFLEGDYIQKSSLNALNNEYNLFRKIEGNPNFTPSKARMDFNADVITALGKILGTPSDEGGYTQSAVEMDYQNKVGSLLAPDANAEEDLSNRLSQKISMNSAYDQNSLDGAALIPEQKIIYRESRVKIQYDLYDKYGSIIDRQLIATATRKFELDFSKETPTFIYWFDDVKQA